jgi:hypothetical protein
MADPELTRILSELVKANATRRLPNAQQVSGLSQAILASAGAPNPYKSDEQFAEDPRGPSIVNRVLDVMSRPLYTVLNPVNEAFEAAKESAPKQNLFDYASATGSELLDPRNYWAGLSGKEKTTGRDILDTTGLSEHLPGPAKFAAGLGIDILADPLTYVGGVGLLPKLGKGAKTGIDALREVETAGGRAAQSLASDISNRAAKQADDLSRVVPEPGMPAPKLTDPPRVFEAGPGPVGGLDNFAVENRARALETVDEPTLKLDVNQSSPMKALPAAPVEEVPRLVDQIRVLGKQIADTKNPIKQQELRVELRKLNAGVKPADLFTEARNVPPPFPYAHTTGHKLSENVVNLAKGVAQRFLKNNKLTEINHVGQSRLYDSIINTTRKIRKDRRGYYTLQMLRIAEDEILAAGRKLTDAEGISVRLSDIANIAGGPKSLTTKLVDDFRKARPSQWTEDLKTFTSPQVASEVLDPVVKTASDIAPELAKLPPSQTVIVGSEISKALTRLASAAGASAREAGTAKNFIDDLFKIERDSLYSSIERDARQLVRQSMDNVVDADTLYRISQDTYKYLGQNARKLGDGLQQNKVVEGIMTKFSTWWGAKDLKPFSREYIDTARNVASAFSEAITPLVSKTKPSQRQAAWAVATGRRAAITPEEQALADQFRNIVERLMGTHGITSNAESVLARSGTMMKELNDELPVALQLMGKKGRNTLGREFDYSNGNWMHSWKEWDVKEPAEALYQLTRALQMVTRKNAMWDDAAARWGFPKKTAEFQHQVRGIERLKGTYFPKPVADQISNLQRQLERDVFKVPHKSIELFDKVQRMWKTGVTIYSPSHHIRNLNGDIYLSALDGVVSPRPYTIATKVLHAYPTRYKSLENVFNIMDPNLRDAALRARPGNIVLTTKAGDKLTSEQIYQAAESQGIFTRATQLEDVAQGSEFGSFGTKFRPFGGKVYGAATQVTELRDHWVRLAHFVDVLSKSKAPLRSAIEEAGRRVKKFHPDGTDLTGFEQNVLRRVIPFYSWMRKATPLVIEGAVMRPHITLAFPKTMANMQLMTGIESEGPGDPFPVDQMFPDWIKEKGVGPLLQPGSGLGRDENWRGPAPGYTVVNPTNPFIDQTAQLGSPGKTILSSLTPAARVPLELLTGQTTLGIPLDAIEGGTPGYLAQQVPAVGTAARLTGATRDNEPWNPEQLINWGTGMGVTGTGPYQQQAQLEIRELLRQLAEKQRGDYR